MPRRVHKARPETAGLFCCQDGAFFGSQSKRGCKDFIARQTRIFLRGHASTKRHIYF
jgi:hypothetical protein